MRIANGIMLLLFLLAIAVQYNDPDPIRWMVIYAIVAGFTAMALAGRYSPWAWLAALGFLASFVYWLPGVDLSHPQSLVTDVRMNSLAVEETREAFGLLICAVWMAVLGLGSIFRRRKAARDKTTLSGEEVEVSS